MMNQCVVSAVILSFILYCAPIGAFRRVNLAKSVTFQSLPARIQGAKAQQQGVPSSSRIFTNSGVRVKSSGEQIVDSNDGHLFRFGIIADIQYAEAEDSLNFDRTKYRRYRHSMDIFRKAIRYWKEEKPVDFTLALGDIVDAKAASKKMQSQCLQKVLEEHNELGKSLYVCFGNHCQYCFSRDFLRDSLVPKEVLDQPQFRLAGEGGVVPKHLFYHWSPFPGWRFVSVDSYDLSIIAPSCSNHGQLSEELITANNPNDLNNGSAWFVDQPYDKIRWAPYNGGIGRYQLMQIENILEHCKVNNEKAIFFAHQPVYSPLKPKSLIWNSEDVLRVLWKFGDRVVAWFAGHDHDGQCAIDPFGIHHIVPPAPIECEIGQMAYGSMTVFRDKLEFDWVGDLPRDTYSSWPNTIKLKDQ